MRTSPTIKLIVVNYVIFVSLLVSIEIVGQLYYRVVHGKFLFQNSSSIFKEHPYLSAVPVPGAQLHDLNGVKKISVGPDGFLTSGSNGTGKYNIICLGGSTTFCTGLTDEDTWPFVLQRKLGDEFNVYNLGVPGYTTLEAIIQLSTMDSALRPDVIILYEGWNDIRNYHMKPQTSDYLWHGMSQKTNLNVKQKGVRESFFLIHSTRKIKTLITEDTLAEIIASDSPDFFVDSLYTRNLRLIRAMSRHIDAKVIFVPQVLNAEAYVGTQEVSDYWTPSIQNKALPQLMRRFNDLAIAALEGDDAVVIANAPVMYQWKSEHFIDKAHFSKSGSEIFVDQILLASLKKADVTR